MGLAKPTSFRQHFRLRRASGWKPLAEPTGWSGCFQGKLASSTVSSQVLPFIAITRFWGVCFRSQRLRLARLMGEFPDGFLTLVAVTVMRYGLRSLLSSAIQSLRYQRLMASTCFRSSLPVPPSIYSVSVGIPSWTGRSLKCRIEPAGRSVFNGCHFPS